MNQRRLLRTRPALLALCLAAACAAPQPEMVEEDAAQLPPTLEGPLGDVVADLMYGAPDARVRAAGDLADMGSEAALAQPHLILALDDALPTVRALAAEALASVGGDVTLSIEALERRLEVDLEESVQSAASAALVEFGPVSADMLLVGLTHERASVRWQCAWALGELGPDVVDTTSAMLVALEDEDEQVRREAARSIGLVDATSPEVVQPLIRALSDESPQVRGNAAWSLGSCGETAKRAVLPLIDALRDEAAEVRMQAARALGELGPHAASASLDLTSALDDPDPKVVHEVNAALSRILAH